MKKIFANNNPDAYAIVDDDVYEIIQNMGLKFSVNNYGYFMSTKRIQLPEMKKKKQLLLHHFVYIIKIGTEPSSTVDHQDRNPLNNCFENLRLATMQEQIHNRGKQKSNSSGYIGVCHRHDKCRVNVHDYWKASIRKPDGHNETKTFPYTKNGKQHAAMWHDSKAREYHGKFHGQLNFPMPTDKKQA